VINIACPSSIVSYTKLRNYEGFMLKKLKNKLRMAVSAGIVLGLLLGMTLSSQQVTAVGCSTIRRGSRGACVQQAQTKLGLLGFLPSTQNDGVFGPNTEAKVREFQTYAGLTADGIVGPQTWAKLDSTTVASMSPYGIPPVCLKSGFVICASKGAQKLLVMRDGKLVLSLDARFGDDRGSRYATAEGLYSITNKVKDEVSREYNNAPMPFTSYFYNGQGMHFSYDFANGDGSNTSHGCIRLRDMNGAAAIFYYVPMGTPVFIWK